MYSLFSGEAQKQIISNRTGFIIKKSYWLHMCVCVCVCVSHSVLGVWCPLAGDLV